VREKAGEWSKKAGRKGRQAPSFSKNVEIERSNRMRVPTVLYLGLCVPPGRGALEQPPHALHVGPDAALKLAREGRACRVVQRLGPPALHL